jgi:hypothetical protein
METSSDSFYTVQKYPCRLNKGAEPNVVVVRKIPSPRGHGVLFCASFSRSNSDLALFTEQGLFCCFNTSGLLETLLANKTI